jgi:hypothetical protein
MRFLRNRLTQHSVNPASRTNRLRKKQAGARQALRTLFRPGVEMLEDRIAPTANIAITNAFVVDGNANPLATASPGQRVYIEADFTTQNLSSNASYRVRFTVNGVTLNSSYVSWGAGSSGTGHWYMYWGTFLVAAGNNQVTATVDPDQSVPESSYADNSRSFTFSASPTGMNPWSSIGGQALSATTALDANGNLDAFAIGSDNGVYYQLQTPGGDWSGWIALGNAATSISAIRDSLGDLDVFAIGTNRAVTYDSQLPNGSWSGWINLGEQALSLSTALDSKGDLDVFVVGTNHAVLYTLQTPQKAWSGWTSLGGTAAQSVSASLDGKGDLDVFAIGTSQAVYYRSQTSPGGLWSGWAGLGGSAKSITTILDAKGNLDLFDVGTDQVVYERSEVAIGKWTSWTSLTGSNYIDKFLSVSATLDAQGDLALFAVGTDNAMYYQVALPGGSLGGWMPLDGWVNSPISAVCDAHGNYDIFAIGSDNGVWYRAGGLSYSPASGTLFNPATGKPSDLDVQQGNLGDCWLLSGLTEVAARDPQDIVNMFTYDGSVQNAATGAVVSTYTVRFFNSQGVAQYVTVDTTLPDGGTFYDQPINGVLWVALAEKAYAQANAAGIVTTNPVGNNAYDALEYGCPSWLFQAVTGKPAKSFNTDPSDFITNLVNEWDAGDLICICTSAAGSSTAPPTSPYIVDNHCYALVGYDKWLANPFQVLNPFGGSTTSVLCPDDNQVYGLFRASGKFLSQNFCWESTGGGHAPESLGTELPVASVAPSQPTVLDAVFANFAAQPAEGPPAASPQDQSQPERVSPMLAQRLTGFDSGATDDYNDSGSTYCTGFRQCSLSATFRS